MTEDKIMAILQKVLFTLIPNGITVNGRQLPISVVVSPRLYGDDKLGSFPDWLQWTQRLKENGLTLTIACDNKTRQIPIDTKILRPDLWEQLFNEETLVRSHTFDDYTQHGIISYSVRQTLSALKTVYQEAGIKLALPDNPSDKNQKEDRGKRNLMSELVDGFDVHWNDQAGKRWRQVVRNMYTSQKLTSVQQAITGPLDSEGLYITQRDAAAFKNVAVPFSVFHHMPTPKMKDNPITVDTDNVLDFHQVLSSLNSYPELQRALGLVLDLQLPADLVATTGPGQYKTMYVKDTSFKWEINTQNPPWETAYVNLGLGNQHIFFTAPRILNDPNTPTSILGLLNLDPQRFGVAQVDVDGAMHKTIMVSETYNNPDPGRNTDPYAQPERAQNPEIFDPEATLPSLRSGGFSLFADRRGLQMLDSLTQSKSFNNALESGNQKNPKQPRPYFAEDLVRGYRLDVWDSKTSDWHSLHLRSGDYTIGDKSFNTKEEEGFIQMAAMQPAEGADPADKDLYLHEAIARWAGWSLSVSRPGKHLSRYGDPDKAVPPDGNDPDYLEDQPDTPYKMTVKYNLIKGSLPRLKFGTRYRIRARAVDLAGNSLKLKDNFADALSAFFALPLDPEGITYMRYEPVAAPYVIIRNEEAITDPGSAVDRIVIRTYNDDISKDAAAADTTAADRHIVPPRTSVEMGEQLGMFDDANGKLKGDAATWKLISDRDAGELPQTEIDVAGNTDKYPIITGNKFDKLPYLPDLLSRGAAIRDLPGTESGTVGSISPDAGATGQVDYQSLSDPNPRPGSATMISFNGAGDWENVVGFRLSLIEPAADQTDLRPSWDPDQRLLSIYLPKGQTRVVPLSSYLTSDDLKLMGVWQWIRQYIELLTVFNPQLQVLIEGADIDQIAHVLQRSVEGGHWMLTPPRLITLVHAVQQPIGKPSFTALNIDHENSPWDKNPLQTAPFSGISDPAELAPVTTWRRPGSTDAYLMGALRIHGPSTAKVDIRAEWNDPVDDPTQLKWTTQDKAGHVDELSLPSLNEGYLNAKGKGYRTVGYYDPEHDQIAFTRNGDVAKTSNLDAFTFSDAAPRHNLNDTKRHIIKYTAISSSRYQEYFSKDEDLEFTRSSESVTVDVPASARPLAPDIVYVIPTFGWQRQKDTNLKRSVRFGGGLRIYMRRPWFSSGEGELLGVTLWDYQNGSLSDETREAFKPYFTQWGMDPIWQTGNVIEAPSNNNFPDSAANDYSIKLEETSDIDVNVAGFEPRFDEERGLWYADLTVNTFSKTYMPFIRLALVRYQPHALVDAKISRVVLADFAQLTPDRSAMVTSDPHHPRTLRVVISGVAPRGPHPNDDPANPATRILVKVQERDTTIQSDVIWNDVPSDIATITATFDDHLSGQPDLVMWAGEIVFKNMPEVGKYRLLIEEYEYITAEYKETEGRTISIPGRLIYAETFELDDALISEK